MEDKNDYLHILKKIDLRPGKVKVEEFNPVMLNEQAGKNELQNTIIKWFTKNPKPKDDEVHAFADKMGIDKHQFEQHVYAILGDILSEGRSKGFTGSYDPKEMAIGKKVEMEHTTIVAIAEKISHDHLVEIPDYYTRLKKMEGEAGIKD
jgi:hypothetical protein